jgi:hypothetical protein
MELAGAAGLAAAAPAAFIAATNRLDAVAWALWGLMAAQNATGTHYVRLRIADTHRRQIGRGSTIWSHAAGLALVVAIVAGGLAPWPVIVPFVAFLARAVWATRFPRPLANIKRFGFSEVGVELVSGLWIAAAYLLA